MLRRVLGEAITLEFTTTRTDSGSRRIPG